MQFAACCDLSFLFTVLLQIWMCAVLVSAQVFEDDEQAVIVLYGGDQPSNQTFANTTTITLVCVAFGRPDPEITWESHDQGIASFYDNQPSPSSVFIDNFNTNDGNFNYTVSMLQICDVISVSQLFPYTCVATNGVTSEQPIGTSNFTFFADNVAMTTVPSVNITSDFVTMTTTDVVAITTQSESVTTTIIISLTVLGCVVALSLGLVAAALIVVRGVKKASSHANKHCDRFVSSTQSPSEEIEYRSYTNSLYSLEGKQTTTGSEQLYVCGAYESAQPAAEYAYVESPTAVQRLNNQGGAKVTGGSKVQSSACNQLAINKIEHFYDEPEF